MVLSQRFSIFGIPLCLVFLTLALAPRASAEVYEIKKCVVKFETRGSPVMVTIAGSSKKPCVGKVDVSGDAVKSAEITMPLDDMDTGIPLRNKHLRDNYLKVEQFPTATVKLKTVQGLADQLSGKAKGPNDFTGTLNLKGKEANIREGKYSISGGKKIEAKFEIELTDHGVDRPSFMGVKVVEAVKLTILLEI